MRIFSSLDSSHALAMDSSSLLARVDEPCRSRVAGLLDAAGQEGYFLHFGGSCMCVGEAVAVKGNVIDTRLFKFVPDRGWIGDVDGGSLCQIFIPDLEKRPTHPVCFVF